MDAGVMFKVILECFYDFQMNENRSGGKYNWFHILNGV